MGEWFNLRGNQWLAQESVRNAEKDDPKIQDPFQAFAL